MPIYPATITPQWVIRFARANFSGSALRRPNGACADRLGFVLPLEQDAHRLRQNEPPAPTIDLDEERSGTPLFSRRPLRRLPLRHIATRLLNLTAILLARSLPGQTFRHCHGRGRCGLLLD